MKNKISIVLILSFLFSNVTFIPISIISAADSGTFTDQPIAGSERFSTKIKKDFSREIRKWENYKVKSYNVILNGINKGQIGNYNSATNRIEIPEITGRDVPLKGKGVSEMYYDIWRTSSGKEWTMASGSGAFTFTAAASTLKNGVSQYPGKIPSLDNTGASVPPNLRFPSAPDAGDAAAWSDRLGPPSFFEKDNDSKSVSNSVIDPKSVNIISATPANYTFTIDYFGKGQDGFGYIKLHKYLSESNSIENVDFIRLSPSTENGVQGRRYNSLQSEAIWTATTYEIQYEITVTYERIGTPTKPDLIADDITSSGAIEVGKAASFTATYHNEGLDINKSFNVKVTDEKGATLKLDTKPSIKSGESASLTFTSTFTTNTSKTFKLTVDNGGVIDESNESNNTVQRTFTIGGTPTPTPNKNITADFDVLPPSIDYGDNFTVHPKDLQLGVCRYTGHMYKFTRGSNESITGWYDGYTDTVYSRTDYPRVIGQGNHQVYMKVSTDCGATDWIGPKPLEVKGPKDNHPPEFKLAWVKRSDPSKPVRTAMEGDILDLIVVQDPSVPTPYDPDGDDFIFDGFDHTRGTSWIKSLKGKYPTNEWGMYEVRMEKGTHTVYGTGRDQWGATAEASTFITVESYSPIPIIKCPVSVIENHNIPSSAFDSSGSYGRGSPIDHSRDEWQNKQTNYANGTGQNIIVTVKLDVYDMEGRKSENPASCDIIVKPDQPPIAKLDVPPLGIRNEPNVILNKSYSPDGDEIISAKYKYKYDALNNGFADDAWQPLTGTLKQVVLTSSKVGKYLLWTEVEEDYGLKGNTDNQTISTLTLNIVNNAPEVSFDLKGKNPQPDLDASTTIRPDKMMSWPVYVTNSDEEVYNKLNLWKPDGGSLVGGEGRNFGSSHNNMYAYKSQNINDNQVYYTMGMRADNGFGPNSLSPFRSLTNTNKFDDFLYEDGYPVTMYDPTYAGGVPFPVFKSTKKLVLFTTTIYQGTSGSMTTLYGLNPKKLSKVVPDGNGWFTKKHENGSPFEFTPIKMGVDWNKRTWEISGSYLYFLTANVDQIVLDVRNPDTGQLIRSKTFPKNLGMFPDMVNWNFDEWEIVGATKNEGVMLRAVRNLGTGNDRPYPLGTALAHYLRVEPDLQVTRLGDINKKPKISTRGADEYEYNMTREVYMDPAGNTYTYEGYSRGLNTGYNLNNIINFFDLTLNKYDSDMKPVWSKTLSAPEQLAALNPNAIGMFAGMTTHNYSPFYMNTFANTIYAQVYQLNAGGLPESVTKVVSMRDGTIQNNLLNWNMAPFDWNGSLGNPDTSTRTTDNYRTDSHVTLADGCEPTGQVTNPSGGSVTSFRGCGFFREYVGDGLLIQAMEVQKGSRPQIHVTYGDPSTASLVRKAFTNGQFVSDVSLNDAEVKFSLRMTDVDVDQESMGFSFRMQDPRNRYAVETNGHSFDLVKYVNGNRSVLQSGNYAFQSDVSYAIKIKMVGNRMDVSLNNIPILSASDGQFTEGRFGYFSDKAYVRFSALTYKAVENKVEWSSDYAIWDEGTARADVQYENIQFLDPEGDPKAGSYQWSFDHTPRFINNQGISALNGRTFESEQLTFDKVGNYIVKLQAKDDPHPDYRYPDNRFGEYRKDSNAFIKKVTVHRRPVSQFTVTSAADGKVIWSDSSYDPDRYESPAKYSTENTGIDYRTTRGILEKKFYYVTPSGETVYQKLVTPQEKGMYEIGMAVKDEYGAWSAYTVRTLDIGTIPANNTPPVPGFNQSHVNTFRGVTVTFDSTAYDKEDGGRENLPHQWFLRNITTNGDESISSSSRTQWQKSFSSLGLFKIRQWIQDSSGAEAQIEKEVKIVNRLPQVSILVPASKDQNQPTEIEELRPLLQWSYQDGDQDAQTRYQLQIYRYGGELLVDSAVLPGQAKSWRASSDLPEGVHMYVKARSYDGYDWSPWSDPGFFWIKPNQPPIAEFDWEPKPVYEGDPLKLIDQSMDPDGDPLTERWEVLSPSGKTTISESPPTFQNVLPGEYRVRLTVSDGKYVSQKNKTIPVQPLILIGDVEHTPEWRKIHVEAGHAVSSHLKDFYAGEKWIVSGFTSPAPVQYVTASFRAKGKDGTWMESRSVLKPIVVNASYRDTMYHAQWGEVDRGLEKGIYAIQFEVLYANGVRKYDHVQLNIIGFASGTIGVHRKQ